MHRHHPPLVYGRGSLGLAPEFSEGAALCALDKGPTGLPTYAVVTYRRGFQDLMRCPLNKHCV